MKVRVWLSLGSNIERERHLRAALESLSERFGKLWKSSVYESEAVGFEGAPFLNMVVGMDTDMPPRDLTLLLHEIEDQEGRKRGEKKFCSRTLDIDLLTYGDQVIERNGVVEIPRDEITRYGFVLGPLAEVAGQERHPLLGRRYEEIWAGFDQQTSPLHRVELAFGADRSV